jgi:cation:H+ antiporter
VFVDALLWLASLLMILLASVLFTNGIELLGHRLKMHQSAVGSVLAAVGTALPETVVPIIAIAFIRDPAAIDVGIGAIAGAPFMLATLGLFITGAAVIVFSLLGRRTMEVRVPPGAVARDLTFFLVLYGVAVLTTFIPICALRVILALALLGSYAIYLRNTICADGEALELPDLLWLTRVFRVPHRPVWIVTQVAGSLALMLAGAHIFVGAVERIADHLGIAALLVSILLTPIATELPEKLNSILWVRRKKDALALGNMTGAMVFQSCFPVVFGMIFTRWELRGATMVSALIALAMGLFILGWVKVRKSLSPWPLLVGGLMYGVFIAYVPGVLRR